MPITTDLSDPIGQVRLEIGDDDEGNGVRPRNRNFTDEAVTYFLTQEGSHIGRTAARACEVLAREWAKIPTAFRIGPEGQRIQAAVFYRIEAQRLRNAHGHNQRQTTARPSGVVGVVNYPPGTAPT